MATAPITTDTPTAKSGVSTGIRMSLAIVISIAIGIFMILWDGHFLVGPSVPNLLGALVFAPLLAMILGFISNSLIQKLSCGKVQWGSQAQRILVVPLPFIFTWGLLYLIPGMRWPIEGLVQGSSPEIRSGLSSGFYAFWVTLYTQSVLNGISQVCPK